MERRIEEEEEEAAADPDKARLSPLGYKQELKRHLTMLENFAFSFSIISVLTGITTTYNTGLRYGGPVSATLGWLLVSLFNGCVALSTAEICSSYTTAGGLYYWSAKLAGPRWAPLASWITGWFNIVGQWAGTTSIDFSLAQMLQVIVLLSTGGVNGAGYFASKYVVLGVYAAFLIIHGAINIISVKWVSFFCQLGAIWNFIGVILLTILIPAVATEKKSPKFVFSHFNSENDAGIHNKPYIFVLGLLMSQYTMGGFDTSVHMTEETKNADVNGPKAIINSVAISAIVGYIYLVSITFTVRDIPYLLRSDNETGGYAIAETFYLVFKNRYGTGVGGIICLGVVAMAVFFCGVSAVASNSRKWRPKWLKLH